MHFFFYIKRQIFTDLTLGASGLITPNYIPLPPSTLYPSPSHPSILQPTARIANLLRAKNGIVWPLKMFPWSFIFREKLNKKYIKGIYYLI